MKPRTIVQLNFYFMALVILVMMMMKLNNTGLPDSLHLLLGIEKAPQTVIKATRGQ